MILPKEQSRYSLLLMPHMTGALSTGIFVFSPVKKRRYQLTKLQSYVALKATNTGFVPLAVSFIHSTNSYIAWRGFWPSLERRLITLCGLNDGLEGSYSGLPFIVSRMWIPFTATASAFCS